MPMAADVPWCSSIFAARNQTPWDRQCVWQILRVIFWQVVVSSDKESQKSLRNFAGQSHGKALNHGEIDKERRISLGLWYLSWTPLNGDTSWPMNCAWGVVDLNGYNQMGFFQLQSLRIHDGSASPEKTLVKSKRWVQWNCTTELSANDRHPRFHEMGIPRYPQSINVCLVILTLNWNKTSSYWGTTHLNYPFNIYP